MRAFRHVTKTHELRCLTCYAMQKLSEVKIEELQRQKSFVRLFDQTEGSVASQRSELLAYNTSALFEMGDASHPRSSGNRRRRRRREGGSHQHQRR